MKNFYEEKIELEMQLYYETLSEKEGRHYAAVEANKLGYGGISYISRLLGVNRHKIYKGIKELAKPSLLLEIPEGKQRRPGGGRKKKKKK